MNTTWNRLLQALNWPESATSLTLADWDLLVRQARRAGLLARLCALLDEKGLLARVPYQVARHLEAARNVAMGQQRFIRWQAELVHKALPDTVPIILLKGSAYVIAKLPPARGRLFYDVDIMVPKDKLDLTEQALFRAGWITTELDEYNQRYYRQWTHELPPLRHVKRQAVLDVHHTIVPQTARLHPDPKKLLGAARPLNDYKTLKILAPADMVLHSATHLFNEGEFENGLRDLVDLDDLLRHFAQNESFWPELVDRAKELDLTRPLYYALRYTQRFLGTPVPEQVQRDENKARPTRPAPILMDAMFSRALAPDHPSCNTVFTRFARFFLYVRGHYLRMPLHLLIPHLLRKLNRRRLHGSKER